MLYDLLKYLKFWRIRFRIKRTLSHNVSSQEAIVLCQLLKRIAVLMMDVDVIDKIYEEKHSLWINPIFINIVEYNAFLKSSAAKINSEETIGKLKSNQPENRISLSGFFINETEGVYINQKEFSVLLNRIVYFCDSLNKISEAKFGVGEHNFRNSRPVLKNLLEVLEVLARAI